MSEPHAPRASSATRRRRWLGIAISLLLTGALVALALGKLNLGGVGHALATVEPGWIAAAAALMILSFMARAESWFAVLRAALPGVPIGRGLARRGIVIGMAGSTVAPGRFGEAARVWTVARHLDPPSRYVGLVTGTVLSQTLLNVVALAVLTATALSGGAITAARLTALVAVVLVPAVLVIVMLTAPEVLQWAARSRRRRVARAAEFGLREAVLVRRGLRAFGSPRSGAHAIGFQFAGWGLQLAMCYATLRALGHHTHATVAAAAAVLVAVNLSAIVPLTPSNVGVFQAACIAVLAPFGVAASHGLAYGLILQAVEVACALALGIPALLREGISARDIRAGDPAARARGPADGEPDADIEPPIRRAG